MLVVDKVRIVCVCVYTTPTARKQPKAYCRCARSICCQSDENESSSAWRSLLGAGSLYSSSLCMLNEASSGVWPSRSASACGQTHKINATQDQHKINATQKSMQRSLDCVTSLHSALCCMPRVAPSEPPFDAKCADDTPATRSDWFFF